MSGSSLLVWVLFLIMPAEFPDVPISQPTLTLEECSEKKERAAAPLPLVCVPQRISWADLT